MINRHDHTNYRIQITLDWIGIRDVKTGKSPQKRGLKEDED